MRQVGYREFAPEGSLFAPGAFEPVIGQEVTVTFGEVPVGTGRLTKAEVAEDGRSAWLTIDMPEAAAPLVEGQT